MTDTAGAAETIRMGTARGRWILLTTVLGSGLAMLDSTVVNIALERIGAEFDASFAALQWTINGYTLTLAGLILLGGSLGDRFGRRKIFLVGVVWFAVASALCGLAPSVELLIAGRALQGVGGALLTPGSLALISASFHGEDRAAAIGAWSGLGGVAGAVGPFLGGFLVEWTWRAVFLINLPLAAVVVVVALRHVPESRDPQAATHLDVPGTVLAVAGLAALTWALTAAGEEGSTASAVVAGAIGVLALIAFVLVERRARAPLVPGELFANPRFTGTNIITLLVYGALGVNFLLVVLQLQVVAGFSPLAAGMATLPITLIMLVLSARSGRLAQRIGPRWPMTIGLLLAATAMLLLRRIGPDASYFVDVLPPVALFGLGLAGTVAPLTATVLDAADDRHVGIASGVNNAIARAAGLLAVALIPAVAGISGQDYTDPPSFAAGYRIAMAIAAGLLAVGAVLSAVLLRPRRTPATTAPEDPDDHAPERFPTEVCTHCGVTAPQQYPRS
ncbi:MFS transporter [Actinomycetospora sp. NBRC 106375]|uniref:MFS transporter n=1 Tax=Actinomycetospora sp. NBRC 106375 TaxID=3032207 RepID=UPI0024A08185|nr:MFS transporter [Actinomycetospora sp. NBRC 106375]GLZ44407.1 MFS transporter [Actinomycetospora sp. NBRC 106375]